MIDEILKRKEEFKLYMKSLYTDEGSVYSETTITAYCYALEQATSKLNISTPLVNSNIFAYDDVKSFNRAYGIIVGASNYSKVDTAAGNRTFSSALLHYSNFLKVTGKNGKKSQAKAKFIKWFNPLLESLRELDGFGSPQEVFETIASKFSVTDVELSMTNGNDPNTLGSNKFTTEVIFAVNYLASAGFIDDSEQDVWRLTEIGKTSQLDNNIALKIFIHENSKNKTKRVSNTKKYWLYPIEKMYKTNNVFVSDDGLQLSNWSDFKQNQIITIPFGEIGDLRGYTSRDKMKSMLRDCFGNDARYLKTSLLTWQFVNEIQIGDIIYVQENNKILGRGIVTSEYGFDENRDDNYNHTREVKWTNAGEWLLKNPKSFGVLTDITKYIGYVDEIKAFFNDNVTEVEEKIENYESYTKYSFLNEVYMNETEYDRLSQLLKNKKNIILQGCAGVGKTYIAKRLAWSMLGEKNIDQVKTIQFHQSYSYEDFFMGYRPSTQGLELQYGVFYNFCKKAEIDKENNYYFIIDEINRGNLSKIFGELFMLIENDKRGEEIQLTYTNELFSIPENVYIIGMMNTSDRGLAMLDYAMRRRFGFYEVVPAFDTPKFMEFQKAMKNDKFDKLIIEIRSLNRELEFDDNLGKGFLIGHSYFGNDVNITINDDWLQSIIDYEILSLLSEYWYDEPSKVREWKKRLNGAVK